MPPAQTPPTANNINVGGTAVGATAGGLAGLALSAGLRRWSPAGSKLLAPLVNTVPGLTGAVVGGMAGNRIAKAAAYTAGCNAALVCLKL